MPSDPLGEVGAYLDTIADGTVEIKRMHVDPDHQRQGHGQRILDELQQRARNRGHTGLVLNTLSLQSAAQYFYESNGFTELDREHVTADGRSFDVVIYHKRISETSHK